MNIGTKQAEIDYPKKLNNEETAWLHSKPFGDFNLGESIELFKDFSTILFLINKYCHNAKNILELGCGPGWLSIFLKKMGFAVSGYDISEEMINVAKERSAGEDLKINFEAADIEDDFIKVEENKNDVVIIFDALHHCANDYAVIEKSFKYLKKGGILLLAEPNRAHNYDKDAAEATKRFGVTERGFSSNELISKCLKAGFKYGKRYHASGQAFTPRGETFKDSLKMIFFPLLTRFVYGKFRTRLWIIAQK